jgi:hypothetical protein
VSDVPRLLRAADLAARTQYLSLPNSRLQLTVRLIPAGSSVAAAAAGQLTLLLLRGLAHVTLAEQPDHPRRLQRGDLLLATRGYQLQAARTTLLLEIAETAPVAEETA